MLIGEREGQGKTIQSAWRSYLKSVVTKPNSESRLAKRCDHWDGWGAAAETRPRSSLGSRTPAPPPPLILYPPFSPPPYPPPNIPLHPLPVFAVPSSEELYANPSLYFPKPPSHKPPPPPPPPPSRKRKPPSGPSGSTARCIEGFVGKGKVLGFPVKPIPCVYNYRLLPCRIVKHSTTYFIRL